MWSLQAVFITDMLLKHALNVQIEQLLSVVKEIEQENEHHPPSAIQFGATLSFARSCMYIIFESGDGGG